MLLLFVLLLLLLFRRLNNFCISGLDLHTFNNCIIVTLSISSIFSDWLTKRCISPLSTSEFMLKILLVAEMQECIINSMSIEDKDSNSFKSKMSKRTIKYVSLYWIVLLGQGKDKKIINTFNLCMNLFIYLITSYYVF